MPRIKEKTFQEWVEKTRKKIEKRLKRPIPEVVWEVAKKYINDAYDIEIEDGEGEGYEFLLEKVKEYLEVYNEGKKGSQLPPIKSPDSKEIPPDRRFWALTKIVTALANRDEEVQKFRLEVLGGKLLSPEEAPKWIEEQANKEQHTLTISFDVTAGEGWEDRLLEEVKQFVKAEKTGSLWSHGLSLTVLDYISPPSQWVHRVPINKKGVLGRLKRLAKKFSGFWNEASAVHFILTGQPAVISPARIGRTIVKWGVPRIKLEVSPHLRHEEVAKLYLKVKEEHEQDFGKTRKLSEKHLTLAVFVVEEEGSWQELLNKWNEKYPQWRYKEKRTFARDAKVAYERVTGCKWGAIPF
jgi:hypothetical protein